MAKIIDSLFVALGYKVDDEVVKKFNKGLETTAKYAKRAALAVTGIASATAYYFKQIAAGALDQFRFARTLGMTRDSLAAIQRVSEALTGSANVANSALQTLFSNSQTFRLQGEVDDNFARALAQMGVDLDTFLRRTKPDEQLLLIAEAVQQLNDEEALDLINLLGLAPETFNLLRQLDRELLRQAQPAFMDEKKLQKVADSWNQLRRAFEDMLVRLVTSDAFDTINKWLEQLIAWLPRAEEDIGRWINNLIEWGRELRETFEAVREVIQGVSRILGFGKKETTPPEPVVPQFMQNFKDFYFDPFGTIKGWFEPSATGSKSEITINQDISVTAQAGAQADSFNIAAAVRAAVEDANERTLRRLEAQV